MSNTQLCPIEVTGYVQNYQWGKPAGESTVFQLAHSNTPAYGSSDPDQRYAELWYGTHVNGPSSIIQPGHKNQIISPNEGTRLSEYLNTTLPFILKVLSINQALSLQAHPDKTLAEQLHASFPQIYRDPNHKPELVVALKPTRALCGFRPLAQILDFMHAIPEFGELLSQGKPLVEEYLQQNDQSKPSERTMVQRLFEIAMTAPVTTIEPLLQSFLTRNESFKGVYAQQLQDDMHLPSHHAKDPNAKIIHSSADDYIALMYHLTELYGVSDMGVFGACFLYYFTLLPNQSVFLGPNIPHAYLYGEVVEAMACSDNVVRAGFTPKFRDVNALINMLTYETYPPDINLGKTLPTPSSPPSLSTYTVSHHLYSPPYPDFPEFALIMTRADVNLGSPTSPGQQTFTSQEPQSFTLSCLPVDSIMMCIDALEGSTLSVTVQRQCEGDEGQSHNTNTQSHNDDDSAPQTHQFTLAKGTGIYIPPHALLTLHLPAHPSGTQAPSPSLSLFRCARNIDPVSLGID